MTFEEYQEFAKQNWKPGCDNITFALGLGGETGEVLEILKKARRDCTEPDMEHLAEELGDVLWYLANLCTVFNFSLADIAEQNRIKLARRYGKIACFRRNGPHIERVDPETGRHVCFCKRSDFTVEELQQIDSAYEASLIAKGQVPWIAERAKNTFEQGGGDDGDECPFD